MTSGYPGVQRDSVRVDLEGQMRLQLRRGTGYMVQKSWENAKIGLFTAGDDSQGMNAAIRAVVRMCFYAGGTVIYIKHGFKGLVDGGDNFEEAKYNSTTGIVSYGGTILKSYKCPEFMERSARVKAAKNLLEHGIQHIIAIGGDGTMKGIALLHKEWISLLRELDDNSLVDRDIIHKYRHLKAVVVLASITNDVVGTDSCIGTDSALHKIIQATDSIATTASSSQLAFVVEVMGKYCGYLALAAGLCCGASMVFIPEWPPQGDWREELCDKVKDDISSGKEGIIVIVSEGAVDKNCHPITTELIRNTLQERMDLNAKITVLGHVQRGGTPSALDRTIATRMGAEALMTLQYLEPEEGCVVIGVASNEIKTIPLDLCIEKTDSVEQLIQAGNFTDAVLTRGKFFQQLLSTYVLLHGMRGSPLSKLDFIPPGVTKIGLLKLGSHMLAQCAVAKAITAVCQTKNAIVLACMDGFEGLISGNIQVLFWDQVTNWTFEDSTCLGASSETAGAVGLEKVAQAIYDLNLSALIIMGGFTAFISLNQMDDNRQKFNAQNNIPGSDVCIGTDTALNEIVLYCDKMKRVAKSRKNCVFVIETMGGYSGYLATLSALCVGADAAYITQEKFNLDTLLKDAAHLKSKILHSGVKTGLVIRNEFANQNYSTEFMYKLFSEEGKDVFSCMMSIIGKVQMGGMPTPSDRLQSLVGGTRAAEWTLDMVQHCTKSDGKVFDDSRLVKSVLCFCKRQIVFKPISKLACETDFKHLVPTYNWWMKLRPLLRIMTKHYEETYTTEAQDMDAISEAEQDDYTSMFLTK